MSNKITFESIVNSYNSVGSIVISDKASGVVAIVDGSNAVVGMGAVLDHEYVITCAHVVNHAIGNALEEEGFPERHVDFIMPLARPLNGDEKGNGKAKVIGWMPIKELNPTSCGLEDIAILKIEEMAGTPAGCVTLLDPVKDSTHELDVFGFPDCHSIGTWAHGQYSGPSANGWIELNNRVPTAPFIDGGFSGSPVYDLRQQAAVGIAVAADRSVNHSLGYLIPTNSLEQAMQSCRWRKHVALGNSKVSTEYQVVDADGTITIVIDIEKEFRLPRDLEEPDSKTLKKYSQQASNWKRVHSISEAMFLSFWKVHQEVLRSAVSGGSCDLARAQAALAASGDVLRNCANELKKLPKSVSSTNVVKAVTTTPFYCNIVMRWLGGPPGDVRVRYAFELADRLARWIMQLLHIADAVLEEFFKPQQRSG